MKFRIMPLRFPVDEIEKAIAKARETKAQLSETDRLANKIGDEDQARKLYGEAGVKEYRAAKELASKQKTEIIKNAERTIDELRKKAVDYINDQVTPSGADVLGDNAADFALIEHSLLETPEQLERVLTRHENAAFLIAAKQYAQRRGWDGFNYASKENELREYVKRAFDGLKYAAADPAGYSFMQYADTPDEYQRSADASGLMEEFIASGGARLRDAISEG